MRRPMMFFIMALLCVLTPVMLRAQSLADEIERLTLDYEKLSQLKAVLANMKKGYEVLSKGYEAIRSIAEGNFNLHKTFLDGLLAVSPIVRDYEKVARIISEESALVSEYRA